MVKLKSKIMCLAIKLTSYKSQSAGYLLIFLISSNLCV